MIGVSAFAVTLLVLGIRIPRLDDPDASRGPQQPVVQQWPSYVAFALKFIVVGTVWANRRLASSHFMRTDHVLVSLNLLEMMTVPFLPVPTGILGIVYLLPTPRALMVAQRTRRTRGRGVR